MNFLATIPEILTVECSDLIIVLDTNIFDIKYTNSVLP